MAVLTPMPDRPTKQKAMNCRRALEVVALAVVIGALPEPK